MTSKQIIAEVKNLLQIYDEEGLINEFSLNNYIKETLKEFGGNVMHQYSRSILIEKGRGKLPDNFWSLKAAVKCEPMGVIEEGKTKHLQSQIAYQEWSNIKNYWNFLDGKPCEDDGDCSYITESLYFELPDKTYKFYYDRPTRLQLVGHTYKDKCDSNCPNLKWESETQISIDEKGNYIDCNFNNGYVWLWYKGLPIDDRGDLFVPDTSRDKLKNYIIYFSVVRVLESLWLSNDDVNLINKLKYFRELREDYFIQAKNESINKGLQGWSKKLIENNRRNMMKYEGMFRNL